MPKIGLFTLWHSRDRIILSWLIVLEISLTEHFSNIFSRMHVKDGEDVIPMDFIILYIVTTFMSSLKWWIDTNCSMPAEKMARLLMKIISSAGLQVCDVKVI